jgi:type IV secretory pathway VirB2 component (pilin)
LTIYDNYCINLDIMQQPFTMLRLRRFAIVPIALALSVPAFAQGSPWEAAVDALKTSFTGPIAKGLSLVAVVIGGLMFAYGEGHGKTVFAGLIFGCGMALAAVNFVAWAFPG